MNRILFEAIEESLKGTVYESLVEEMFFGVNTSYIVCPECGAVIKVDEKFIDLPLHVQGIKGVHQSLKDYFTPEDIEGVWCQTC